MVTLEQFSAGVNTEAPVHLITQPPKLFSEAELRASKSGPPWRDSDRPKRQDVSLHPYHQQQSVHMRPSRRRSG